MNTTADPSLTTRVRDALRGHDDTAEVFVDGSQLRVVTLLDPSVLARLLAQAGLPLALLSGARESASSGGCGCGGGGCG